MLRMGCKKEIVTVLSIVDGYEICQFSNGIVVFCKCGKQIVAEYRDKVEPLSLNPHKEIEHEWCTECWNEVPLKTIRRFAWIEKQRLKPLPKRRVEHLQYESIEEIPNYTDYLNKFGEVRRENVEGRFDLNEKEHQDALICLYRHWVQDDNYFALECKTDKATTYHAVKCSKRGNDVDMRYAERKLKWVATDISPYTDYDQTRALKLTVTIDPKKYNNDINKAWEVLGDQWNRFLSVLKKRYGCFEKNAKGETVWNGIHPFRSWECHESGFPHIHAVICFEEKKWLVVGKIPDKYGVPKWRIPTNMAREIASGWKLGFLDVQAIVPESVDDDIEDIVWYILKTKNEGDYRSIELWSRKRLLTLAVMWYLGKQSWSASWKLRQKPDLKSDSKIIQTDIEGNELFVCGENVRWRFLGMIRRADTELSGDEWEKIYPDPPDWLEEAWMPKRMRSLSSPLRDLGFA